MPIRSLLPPVLPSHEALHEKILRALWGHSLAHPNQAALILANDTRQSLTFRELYTQAHSVHAFLVEKGFRKGDVACFVLFNSLEWVVFNLGVWAAGGAVSGASALFTDYELERQFLDSQCSVVFTDEPHIDKALHAARNCPRVKTIVCVRSNGFIRSVNRNVFDYHDAISCRPALALEKVSSTDMALLPYSSGTTGSPKGVVLSHTNFGTMVEVMKDHFERQFFGAIRVTREQMHNETWMLNLPLYHLFGFSLLHVGLLAGITGVIHTKFEREVFMSAIQTFRPRVLITVPPIIIFLAKHPMVQEYDLSSVEVCSVSVQSSFAPYFCVYLTEIVMTAAAPCGVDLCEEFLARHPNVKYHTQGYGLTECTCASHLPILKKRKAFVNSGALLATFEQKTVDPATGKELGVGEKGEICLRGPCVMTGYLNKPEATAITVDGDGWLHTGDIGYYDAEGMTYIVDRMKELIKVKGLQVAPAELEDLLISHPLVADCAVIGIPDDKRGELVRAYVVRSTESLTEREIVQFVAHKVSEYKHLTGGVRFVDSILKSPSGKILRRFLRDEAAKERQSKL